MRTILFYPRVENVILPSYTPLGIMSIATYLNSNGHCAKVHDRTVSNEKIASVIENYKPDIIGVSVISQSFIKDAIAISKVARKFNIPVIWGGCSSTSIAEKILRSGNADYISLNEGEFTWLEIADAFDSGKKFDDIKGIAFLKNNMYIETGIREFIDLSQLPSIDWNLINPEKYMQKTYGSHKMLSIYRTKGCSGKCNFCYNPCFHKSTRRVRPIDKVISEMKFLSEKYGVDGFEFTDETMFESKSEAYEFCNKILESDLKLNWSGYLKTTVLKTKEDFELLYKAGCRMLMFGIETGSKNVLTAIRKPNNLQTIEATINACVNSGILPITTFIIGFPGETIEDVKETIQLAKDLNGALVSMFYFTPLPGTEIYRNLIAENKLVDKVTLEDHSEIVELENVYENFSEIPMKDLFVIKEFFRLRTLFYRNKTSEDRQILKVLISTVQSWKGRGFLQFVFGFLKTFEKLLNAFSVFLHPFIRKKYGLYFNK